METFSVLIIGLGPTGMTLAHELEKHGIDYAIVDKRKAVSTMTRAVNLTPATIASLRFSMNLSLENQAVSTDKIRIFWENNRIADVRYQHMSFPYRNFYYYPQPFLEEKLNQKLNKGTKKELTELVKIKECDNGYEVLLYDQVKNKKYWVKSKYLIGCDGNNSTVREFFTNKNDREDYGANFLLYDVIVDQQFTRDSLYYVYNNGYIIMVPIGEKKFRVILSFSKLCFEKPDQYNNLNFLQEFLSVMLKIKSFDLVELLWFTHSRFSHRIASRSIYGNCILCGDAYHVFSPVGGLNLNTGIQDALNLGWKLAYVIQGKADERLLMTYESERSHIIKKIRDKTKYLTQCITQAGNYTGSKKYITNYRNRTEHRYKLPYLLSGYDSYNIDEYSIYLTNPKVGHHISECMKDRLSYEKFCNHMNPIHLNLIHGRGVTLDNVTRKSKVVSSQQLDIFGRDAWILLRPDGFVVAKGTSLDINNVYNIIQNLLKGEC